MPVCCVDTTNLAIMLASPDFTVVRSQRLNMNEGGSGFKTEVTCVGGNTHSEVLRLQYYKDLIIAAGVSSNYSSTLT